MKKIFPLAILCLGAIALIAQVTSFQGLTGVITNNPGSGIICSNVGQNVTCMADTAIVLAQLTAQAGTPWQAIDNGVSGTIYSTITIPSFAAYTDGMMLLFRPGFNCISGAMTLNVNGIGAKSLVQPDGVSNPIAGECVAKITIPVTYNQSLKTGQGAWVLPR